MEQNYPPSPYFDDRAGRFSAVSDTFYYGPAASTSPTTHQNPLPRKSAPVSHSSDYDPVINPIDVQDLQPVRRFGGNSFLRWWGAEIVASILSIASLLSIVVLLKEYEGKGINDLGLPSWLTLNGIVAIIATINRVCMMLPVGSGLSQEAWLWFSQTGKVSSRLQDLERSDAASRGAWGSLVLLFGSRRRYLAYFGALVTILSLAFGTFTQQLISYSMYPIPSSHPDLLPGNIPRAETWQNFTGYVDQGGLSIPLTMKAAIYNGMLSEGVEPITATCPTGNCTWPVTPSLAVCGECSPSSYQTSCNTTNCTYTMPSGSKMVFPNATHSVWGNGFQVAASKGAKYNSSHHDKLYIANFDVFGAPYNSYSQIGWEEHLTGQECAMWICIKAFDVVTANGHQTQTVSTTFSDINSALPLEAGGVVSGENFTFPPLPANMSGTTPDTNYTVSSFASVALSDYLGPLFNGTVFLSQEYNSPSSDAIEALWNGTNDMNAWMSNLAQSMTNIIRSTTQADRAVYDGSASQVGVHIRWPWIALPASMVLASLVFLIVIIIETARSPIEAWKGSPLAYLVFGVDQETKGSLETHAVVDGYKDLGNTVGRTKAILKHQPTGKWTFHKAS